MEEDNDDNTTAGGGGELETKSVPSAANEKLDETDAGDAAKAECDPVNEPDEAQHSEKNDESTGRESETESVQFAANEKDQEENAAKTEIKCDPVSGAKHSDTDDDSKRVEGESEITSVVPSATNEKGETDKVKEVNHDSSSNMTEWSMEESDAVKDTSPSSQTVSTVTKELDEREEKAAKSEVKCDPVNELGDVKHLKNDDKASVGESEIKPAQSPTTDKGTLDIDMSGNKDKQSVKIFEEINRKEQYQRETETLLGRLHLQDKHQQKLSPADFLKAKRRRLNDRLHS